MKKRSFVVMLCVGLVVSGCGMSVSKPYTERVCWSPDQSYVVQSLDPKGRLHIWIMDGGSMWPYQELHLRWCSRNDTNKPNDVWLKSAWFSKTFFSTNSVYFSQDGTKAATQVDDKIIVVDLLSGKKNTLKPDMWHPEEWISVCESIRDSQQQTECKLQWNELPKNFTAGVVSPDGNYTALIDIDGRVVIKETNLKLKP